MSKYNIERVVYYLFIVAMLTSCSMFHDEIDDGAGLKGDTKNVSLVVQVPSSNTLSKTKSLTEAQEDYVDAIDVLVFKMSDDGDYDYFEYRVTAKNIDNNNGASNLKKFDITLKKSEIDNYRLVVIANARQELDQYSFPVGMPSYIMLSQIVVNNQNKWNSVYGTDGYRSIPMWGESVPMKITDATTSITGIKMLRMIGRVDVTLSPESQEMFKMKSIRVYNNNERGVIVPSKADGNWDGSKVLKPTLPMSPDKNYGEPLIYDKLSIENIASIRDVYLFESEAPDMSHISQAVTLVVGGWFDDDQEETFYKIDFGKKDTEGVFKLSDILRNHAYKFNVTNVSGRGFNTPEEAFNSKSVNLDIEVLMWDEGLMTDVIFDDYYMLSVNKKLFELPMSSASIGYSDRDLTIFTDYPEGWKVEKIIDDKGESVGWLTLSSTNGSSGEMKTVILTAQDNMSNNLREANIHVRAGRMIFVVTVVQRDTESIDIVVKDESGNIIDNLTFVDNLEGSVETKGITVEWYPKDAQCNVELSTLGKYSFDFGAGDAITTGVLTDPAGRKTYTISPPPMDPDISTIEKTRKISKVQFTIFDGVNFVSKNLIIKQVMPIVVIDERDGYDHYGYKWAYNKDGSVQFFNLVSTVDWEVKVTGDAGNAIAQLYTTHGNASFVNEDVFYPSTKVYFKPINDLDKFVNYQDEVTFTITSKSDNAVLLRHTIKLLSARRKGEANSYIVKPGGSGILIPISRNLTNPGGAYLFYDGDGVQADMLWSDNSKFMASNSTIREVKTYGGGQTGYIHVRPGTAEGNATIDINMEHDNNYGWIWHVWVTDFVPPTNVDSGTFMDRNLGALSAGNSTIEEFEKSKGLYYQWGRHHPFLDGNMYGVKHWTGIFPNHAPNWESWQVGQQNASGFYTDIAKQPYDLIVSEYNYYDWDGWIGANTWSDGESKSVYDPCPEGWKVPSSLEALTTSSFVGIGSDGSTFGRINPYKGGFYPAAGYMGKDGKVAGKGSQAFYWTASHDKKGFAYEMEFTAVGGVNPKTSSDMLKAAPIRCVKE